MKILTAIGREKELFSSDLVSIEDKLSLLVSGSKFLVIGGAGAIGQAVT